MHGGRGGYCYEQNGLFSQVLETIGFGFTPLAARVLWRQAEDALTPRTHKLLLVRLGEDLVLADVGFGGAVCTGVPGVCWLGATGGRGGSRAPPASAREGQIPGGATRSRSIPGRGRGYRCGRAARR